MRCSCKGQKGTHVPTRSGAGIGRPHPSSERRRTDGLRPRISVKILFYPPVVTRWWFTDEILRILPGRKARACVLLGVLGRTRPSGARSTS